MSRVGAPRQDPIPIGEIAEPPFARLPDPTTLFQARAGRFRNLSEGHPLAAYLRFLAALSDAQHQLQDGLAVPDLPAPDVRARAKEFGMPPLDRGAFSADATFETTLQRLFSLAREIDMPEPARAALARATGADMATRGGMLRAVLADAVPVEGLADHLFIVAALHVHFARQASRLEAKTSFQLARVPVPLVADRRWPRWWWGGPVRSIRGSAPAHCATPFGTRSASNACSAAR